MLVAPRWMISLRRTYATPPGGTSRIIAFLALFSLLGLSGCNREGNFKNHPVLYDLVQNFSLAEVRQEPTLIDIGTPAARQYLISGWSHDEQFSGREATFVWGQGEKSVLEFFLLESREIQMVFRCLPFQLPNSPVQTITIVANGTEVEQVMLQPKLKEYQIAIPQTALVPGKNRLEFRYAYVGAPADVEKGPKDRRRLAVAWDYIRLDTPRKQPRADAQSGTLDSPFGTGEESTLIDIGTPAGRQYLISGWSYDEQFSGREATFVWSLGKKSALEFSLSKSRDIQMVFRCLPFQLPNSPVQTISIVANGTEVEQVALQSKLKEYQIVIPQTALVPGKNRLEFRYAYVGAPADVEKRPKDRRRLAVAWDYIRLDTVRKQPRADAQSGTLHIPFGAQVDYYFKLAGESILTLDGLTWTGDSRGRLRLILQPAGEREQVLRNLGRSGKFQAVPLTGTAGQIVRLSLGAISPSRNHSDSDGMTLVRPAIRPKEFQQTAQHAPAPRAQPSKGSTRPNIVLYLVDALRADHLGCYGYHKPVSPNIDEFAENATVFENALAQAPWTKPSAASIFTGMYPRTHGVIKRRDALPAEATTLAEILQAEGYNTATFITNGYLGKKFGLHRGFAEVVSLPRARSDQINQKVFAWLDKRGHQQPFFLYIHTLDPHAPYSPPRDFRERFAGAVRQPNLTEETRALLASLQKRYSGPIEVGSVPWMQALHRKRIPVTKILIVDLVSLYDAEIASNDHNFGIFLQELRRRRLFEESLIILVSDHGESFYEHGTWEHGKNLHREVIHVPLIAKFPSSYTAANATKRRIPDLVQQIDILPTILDSLGLVVPENVDGRSLVPLISGKEEKKRQRRAFSYLEVRSWWAGSVIEGPWKLIQHSGRKSSVQLFNLEEGPGEDKNVFDEHPIVASYLLSLVKAQEQGRQTLKPGKAVIDKDLREQLKALGYVQ